MSPSGFSRRRHGPILNALLSAAASMPSSHLKRAERAIQTIRDQAELPLETADALQELVDVVRNIESRLSTLEGKGKSHPTELAPVPIELVGDGQ
jgi:hypothetical protein